MVSDAVLLALIAAVAPTLTVILAARKVKTGLQDIHVLVNGRLSTALQEVKDLREYVDNLDQNRAAGVTSDSLVPRVYYRDPNQKGVVRPGTRATDTQETVAEVQSITTRDD